MADLRTIDIDKIKIPDIRATSKMDPEAKEFFNATIENVGVIQDPVVRPLDDGSYELVAGLSRLNSLREKGASQIQVKVITTDEKTATIMHLAENVARGKVDPISTAKVMKKLLDQGTTPGELCKLLGKSDTWVKRTLMLLDLPGGIQDHITSGTLTPSHVYIAARMPTPDETFEALQTATRLGWNTSILETFVVNRLAEIQAAKTKAIEQGTPAEIPAANPEQLTQFRQCLGCGYRKQINKVLMTYICEDCLSLLKYIASQLGPTEQAAETIFQALQVYFGNRTPESGPDRPTT